MIQWTMITMTTMTYIAHSIGIWCRIQQWCNEQWSMTMTETQLLAPETGRQQQLERGFKQNSAKCLPAFLSQNAWRHPPLAGKILPLLPWQNCLNVVEKLTYIAHSIGIWCRIQQWCNEQWSMTMTETQLLAPETGRQQQLERGFKQNSAVQR